VEPLEAGRAAPPPALPDWPAGAREGVTGARDEGRTAVAAGRTGVGAAAEDVAEGAGEGAALGVPAWRREGALPPVPG
jgi:hypothetical protein